MLAVQWGICFRDIFYPEHLTVSVERIHDGYLDESETGVVNVLDDSVLRDNTNWTLFFVEGGSEFNTRYVAVDIQEWWVVDRTKREIDVSWDAIVLSIIRNKLDCSAHVRWITGIGKGILIRHSYNHSGEVFHASWTLQQ